MPTTLPPPPRDDDEHEPLELPPTDETARFRQIDGIVERERRQRRRVLALCSALLVVPVALAAASLRSGARVGEQIESAVEEKLGGRVDELVAEKVDRSLQGASPAKVRELDDRVSGVAVGLAQVQTSLREVEAFRAELPRIREQFGAQSSAVAHLQQAVDKLSAAPNPNERLAAVEKRIDELDRKLSRFIEQLAPNVKRGAVRPAESLQRAKSASKPGESPRAP